MAPRTRDAVRQEGRQGAQRRQTLPKTVAELMKMKEEVEAQRRASRAGRALKR